MGNPEDEAEREAGRQGRVRSTMGSHETPARTGRTVRSASIGSMVGMRSKKGRGPPRYVTCPGGRLPGFQDGLRHNECPYDPRTQDANEWRAGWRDAEENKRKRDADDALAPTLLLAPQSSLKSPAYPCLERKSQRWPDVKCSLPARVLDPRRLVLELVEVP